MKALFAGLLFLALAGDVAAQAGHGARRMTGTVVDENGAPVAAAKIVITLLEAETIQSRIPLVPKVRKRESAVRETAADKKGRWVFNGIASAKWEIRASRPGYVASVLECDLGRLSRDPRIEIRLASLKEGSFNADPGLLEEANDLFSKGEYDRARALYGSYLTEDPGAVRVMLIIGDCWRKSGERGRAVEAFQRVLERTSGDPARREIQAEALAKIGECRLENGDQDAALDSFRRSVAIWPDQATVQAELGELLFTMGRSDEAIGRFRSAIELAPRDALLRFRLGLVYLNVADHGRARTCFAAVIDLDPDSDLARKARVFLAEIKDKVVPQPGPL